MLVQGLALLLAEQPDLTLVGQFTTGADLLAWLAAAPQPLPADVLLLDLHLPAPDGLTLLPRLQRQWPALRVLVFSTAATPRIVEEVAAAGASGFVPKSAEAGELLAAIRAVHAGRRVFAAPATSRIPSSDIGEADLLLRLHRLSAREREVVGLVRQGLTTREMAEKLFLSEFTVSTHRRNIMHKLELSNVAALVQFAIDYGL